MSNAPANRPQGTAITPVQRTSTALVAGEMPDWLKAPIEKYVNNPHFDLLLPSIPVGGSLHPWYRPTASLVQLSPNPDDGDVWAISGKLALSKNGLMKIADAAGISFHPSVRMDDRSNPDYCEIQASAWMLNSMGQRVEKSAIKAFYMPDVEGEALRQKMRYERDEAKARAAIAGEMAQFRKHLVRRTDTGAKTAVIRELLAVAGNLTAEKVAKPKVCLRFDFVGDMSDPDVKKFMLERATGAAREMYGPAQPVKRDLGDAEEDPLNPAVDEETLAARARASSGGGPVETTESGGSVEGTPTGLPQAEMKLDEDHDWFADVQEGCKAAGLTHQERNRLFIEHQGDLEAIAKRLGTLVDDPAMLKAWRAS